MGLHPIVLAGRKGRLMDIAYENRIACGYGPVFRDVGGERAVTWRNDGAKPHVEPVAREFCAALAMPVDVEQPGQRQGAFAAIREQWGGIDFVLHSIACVPSADLYGRLTDSSRDGFAGRDGTGESGVGHERSLPCWRARPPRHPGQRHVAVPRCGAPYRSWTRARRARLGSAIMRAASPATPTTWTVASILPFNSKRPGEGYAFSWPS